MKMNHWELNNRNGVDWMLGVSSVEAFRRFDWSNFLTAGFQGIAFFITDRQWGKNLAVTDRQWQERKDIFPQTLGG